MKETDSTPPGSSADSSAGTAASVEADALALRLMRALGDVGEGLNRATTVDEIVQLTESWFERVANASVVRISLANPEEEGDAPPRRNEGRVHTLDDAARAVRHGQHPIVAPASSGDTRRVFATRLHAGSNVVGALVVEIDIGRELDEPVVSLLESVAAQLGAAIRRAREAQGDRHLVDSLATNLVPEDLPSFPGVVLAAVYRPAETRAGGDWYDAFSVPGGLVAFVIGDIAGHGPEAAAAMTTARAATRAEAVRASAPEAILEGVNRYLRHYGGTVDPLATEIVVALDPFSGCFRYANGGHLPPLVVGTDGTVRALERGRGLMLGTDFSAHFDAEDDQLEPGELLVLYTDGLVERRGEDIAAGMQRLAAAATRLAEPGDLDGQLDELVNTVLAGTNGSDDVAVLVAARSTARVVAPGNAVEMFEPVLSSVEQARKLVSDMLAVTGIATRRDDALLLTSELATNAVRHAATAYEVRALLSDARLRVDVADLDRNPPQIIEPSHDEPGGRGLLIVDRIADRWGCDIIGSGGKSVWFELEMP